MYTVLKSEEYFIALSNNPSITNSGNLYVHHNHRGVCVHGPNVNSVCAYNERVRLNSDPNISNQLYLCLNTTEAHVSWGQDRHEDKMLGLIEIPRNLNLKLGRVESISASDIEGEDLFAGLAR